MNPNNPTDSVQKEHDSDNGPSVDANGTLILFIQALEFVKKESRKSKKDFIEFILYYNKHKIEIGLSSQEMAALKKLHEMWVQVKKDTPLEYFVEMKKQHTVLNGHLLGITGEKNTIWETYIQKFQTWRCQAMMQHYKLMQCMKMNENSNGNGNNTASSSTSTKGTT